MKNNNFVEKEDTISDPKYQELYITIENLFLIKGLGIKDYFDKQVWFLKNDEEFITAFNSKGRTNKHIQSKHLSTPANQIISLVFSLDESRETMEDISVSVHKFIYSLCEEVINLSKIISRTEKTIKLYNANERVNFIYEKTKILTGRINQEANGESRLRVTLNKLQGIEPGKYDVQLKVSESNGEATSKKIICLKTPLKVSDSSEVILHNCLFEDYEFRLLEKREEKRDHLYSGTTLSSFKVALDTSEGETKYETESEFLFNLTLIYIDDILDLTKNEISKTLELKLNKENAKLVIGVNLLLDNLTRIALMKRANDIFNEVLLARRMSEAKLDSFVKDYFPDIADKIKQTLFKKADERRESCCGCLIY